MWVSMGGFYRGHPFIVVARLIVLPRVSLALARSDHGDFVGSGGAVRTLELNPLSARLVVDAPPFLGASATPVFQAITSSDPVWKNGQRKTFSSTHQLL